MALASVAGAARAADGTCPDAWNSEPCSGVCTTTSTTFSCDVSGAGGASNVTIVSDYYASSALYEAWGDVNGTKFCCASAPGETGIDNVHIEGSAYADALRFSWSALTYNLEEWSQSYLLVATIDGNAGPDLIVGSNLLWIDETLNGGDHWDTIQGNNGDDILNGDDGADTLHGGGDQDILVGGPGEDVLNGEGGMDECYGGDDADVIDGGADGDILYGESGEDAMLGGLGDDTMFGGPGRDRMSGGSDDDTMDGGTEGDTMCGDGEVSGDEVDAGDATNEGAGSNDKLWGADALDTVYCGVTSTQLDPNSTPVGCGSNYLVSRPPACP